MRSLGDMQKEFARALMGGFAADIEFMSGPISSQEALLVHRNTVMGALVGALRLTYPTVDDLVGEEFFNQAALKYVERQPPSHACLSTWGQTFAEFLQTYELAASLPYLADVARLDLAVDQAALGPAQSAQLRIVLDDNVSMDIPEGLRVLCLNYPVDLIKAALGADDDIALGKIDLQASPRWLLVWRVERQIMVKQLAPAAGVFLQMILSGKSADQALAAAVSQSSWQIATEQIQRDVFAASFCRIATTVEEQ